MAMSLPVVAARIGQACEVIDEGRTGWLYTPGDTHELAGLIRMLANSVEQCRVVGAAARDRVMNEYTWHNNARRVVAIAEDLIAMRTSRDRERRRRQAFAQASLARAGGA